MKIVYSFVLLCFFFSGSYAQDQLSLSLFGGTSQYLGDINKAHPYYKPSLSYGAGLTSTNHNRYALSVMFAHHSLSGDAADFPDLNLPDGPANTSFKTTLIDFTATMEFNFLPFEAYNIRKDNFTPFIFAGVGTHHILSGEENQIPLIIPFGLGIKYNIFERFSIGIQWTAKKTFFDRMDGVQNVIDEGNDGSLIHNNDWYHHTVAFLRFHPFRQSIDCPTYEQD